MPVNRICIFMMVLFLFALTSCSQQDKMEIVKSASAFDIKQGEASVSQSNQAFIKSFKSGDTSELAQSFTTTAKVMVANRPPIEGRSNIAQFFSGLIKGGASEIKLKTTKISGDSTILVEEGAYQILNKKGDESDKGQYIALWKQQSGNWKIYRDMLVSSIPKSVINLNDSSLQKH